MAIYALDRASRQRGDPGALSLRYRRQIARGLLVTGLLALPLTAVLTALSYRLGALDALLLLGVPGVLAAWGVYPARHIPSELGGDIGLLPGRRARTSRTTAGISTSARNPVAINTSTRAAPRRRKASATSATSQAANVAALPQGAQDAPRRSASTKTASHMAKASAPPRASHILIAAFSLSERTGTCGERGLHWLRG